MTTSIILEISIEINSKKEVLENIIKNIEQPRSFFHIVSLNPEIIVIAQEHSQFKKVLNRADLRIRDGAGVALAGKILNVPVGDRLTGTDLMHELLQLSYKYRLRTLLIGGSADLANKLAVRYSKEYAPAQFRGVQGITDIQKALNGEAMEEEKELFSIVSSYMPQIVFVAFGSPWQELWLDKHRDEFKGMICMGVGGAFDFYGGKVSRAPTVVRKLGMEWLYRLLRQPWRWKRQLRLLRFMYLIFKERFSLPSY